jgi:hypothetical protein
VGGRRRLTLLATLVRAALDPPLCVIGTYRDTEVAAHDTLAGALADLAHAGLARQHTLGPLPPEDAQHLLATLLDGWPEDAAGVRERVVQRAGGVPFYLVSYAQGLRGDAPERNAAEAVPWDVAQGVRQRIAALPFAAQEVLGAAAVIGRGVPAALLTAVAGPGEREVLAALDAASRARLLLEEDQTYQFAHDLIREVVEGDVGAARRLVLHRRIAEALEGQRGGRAVEVLAYHYGRASVPEKAVHYLEQAGDRAWAQHAKAAAEAYYREAIDGLDRLGRPLASAQAREKLGLVLHMAAQNELTLAVLEQAAEGYRAADDLESQARAPPRSGSSIRTQVDTKRWQSASSSSRSAWKRADRPASWSSCMWPWRASRRRSATATARRAPRPSEPSSLPASWAAPSCWPKL